MRIALCSGQGIKDTDRTIPAWEHMRSLGNEVEFCNGGDLPSWTPDVLISMSVTMMDATWQMVKAFPDAKLFCYMWDCYEWVWKTPREGEYDYNLYGELLRKATEVWVPSNCTGRRVNQWWDIKPEKIRTVLSACPYWDYPEKQIRDGGYVLCCLRRLPDPNLDWFERVCTELKIPYQMPDHQLKWTEYQAAVAHCRFLVAHYYELSTGGLSLMEGYYHGKPVLMSDSPWHGGKDYFGDRAWYFRHDDYKDFKSRISIMWNNPQFGMKADHKEYIVKNFSDTRMIDDFYARLNKYV